MSYLSHVPGTKQLVARSKFYYYLLLFLISMLVDL